MQDLFLHQTPPPAEPLLVSIDDRVAMLTQENAFLRAELERLKRSERAKDVIWSRLGHALRTKLNFVTGFASILGDEIPGQLNRRQQAYVRKILDGADRILRLVDTFGDLAALEAGTLNLARRPTPFMPLVEEAVRACRPLADHKLIRVSLKVDVLEEPSIDGPRVTLALAHLISNAIQQNPEGGMVAVRSRVTGNELRVEVEDGGAGLHPDQVERMLRSEEISPDDDGTGLGMAIARKLVEAHGGRFGLNSEPGRGTTFWFTLPVETAVGALAA